MLSAFLSHATVRSNSPVFLQLVDKFSSLSASSACSSLWIAFRVMLSAFILTTENFRDTKFSQSSSFFKSRKFHNAYNKKSLVYCQFLLEKRFISKLAKLYCRKLSFLHNCLITMSPKFPVIRYILWPGRALQSCYNNLPSSQSFRRYYCVPPR